MAAASAPTPASAWLPNDFSFSSTAAPFSLVLNVDQFKGNWKLFEGELKKKWANFPVQVSALIYPLGHTRLAPFLLGGGWYYTTVKGPGNFDETQNRFGLHVGGGLQFFFSNHISIDSTYRYIWLEDLQSKDQSLQDKTLNDNGHMITVGLNLHF